MGEEESPGWFEQQLRDGRCLVLLDGLDEVARQDDRAKVSAWAEGQVRQFPGNDFVISSRPQGYRSAPVEGADIVQVCGFTPDQVEAFIRGWYQAVERYSTGSVGPEVEALADKGADDLLQRLEQAPALYDLTVNPLLLTMIANVHRYRGALPGSRADLYSEICQVMLWRRQDAKKVPQQIGGDKKEAILRSLAYTMMNRRVSDLSHADVLATIQPALRRMSRSLTAKGFLDDVSTNGLLIERETGQYAFAHKTFQEYLAAAHIRDSGLVSDLADAVNDDWWAETTLLYAATSNADPIVRACLNAESAQALALALDCTDEDNDVDPDLRKRVNDLVIAAAKPDADRERRRMFASILLSRHMRQRKRASGGTQVCAQPIQSELYRLFLADAQTPEPDAPLTESGIAVGMRGSDAAEFVQWANGLSGDQQHYRLPLAAEVTELSAQRRIPALPALSCFPCPWIQEDGTSPGALPLLWLPPGTPEPYRLNDALLADACERDMIRSAFTLNGLLLRSRIVVHTLNLDPNLDLDRARDLDLARYLDLDHARDQSRELAVALDLACPLAPELAQNLDHARDLAQILERTVDRGFGIDAVLDQLLGLAFVLAVNIDLTSTRYMPSGSLHSQARPVFDRSCLWVLGRALSDAIAKSLRFSSQPGEWVAKFTAAFIDTTRIAKATQMMADPANMGRVLHLAVTELQDVLDNGPDDRSRMSAWSYGAAEHLKRRAELIFAGAERPTPEKATAIRMTAVCLAAEADAIERWDIGDMFRQVASGITLLEHRATGELQATEVIMLAVDRSPFSAELPKRLARYG